MTLIEIKSVIHQDIDNISNPEHLEALRIFIETHILHHDEPELNKERIERLKISRQQAKDGRILTNEEADNEIDEWLKE
jgi:hypothetical protein